MRRNLLATIVLLLMAVVAVAQKKYELSDATCNAAKGDYSPWTFNNGFSVSENAGKTYGAGGGGIKYSAGVKYTIHIPDGVEIKYVTISGYDNYAEVDAYLGELGGTEYGENDYVWPQKDASGNSTDVKHAIELSSPVTDELTFTPMGKQVVWIITLYDYVPGGNSQGGGAENFVWPTPAEQMEPLGRDVVAVPAKNNKGIFVSWRLLGTDADDVTFDLLRDGVSVATDLSVSNFTDANGTASSQYEVVVKQNGTELETTSPVTPWANIFKSVKLDRPAGGTHRWREYNSSTKKYGSWQDNVPYEYTPNDVSVGDVDGDGQMELIVKWDPSHSQDNSIGSGFSGSVYLDAYKMDGEQLWRIDLGDNIRAGAHYTQFLVYDFDGDGKAELICKTAPGSKDGLGRYVTEAADDSDIKSADNTKDYRNETGYVNEGPEYLTVFSGETGEALHTIFYNPNRAGSLGGAPSHPSKTFWGDNYGGRADRYLACVAYLGGTSQNPSAVMCRGYYTRAYLWAVDFDGDKLTTRWLHASNSTSEVEVTDADGNTTKTTHGSPTSGGGSGTMYGNGNHNLSVGDVDGDGCDEIIWGSAACDHDGSLLYATGFGHGDAIHLSDIDPDRPGLELFQVHEEKGTYSWDLHDAVTGEVIWKGGNKGVDNGRGMAADVVAESRGQEFWSSDDRVERSAQTGEVVNSKSLSINFRIYWDGDAQDELFDGKYDSGSGKCAPVITKLNGTSNSTLLALGSYGASQTCNTTKATPCLQADLLGDWREEIICWNYDDPSQINIFTTNIPSDLRVPTLLHDHVYRMGVVWQQTAYNQPPHLGYYLPDYLTSKQSTGIRQTEMAEKKASNTIYDLQGRRIQGQHLSRGVYIQNGRKYVVE